MRTEKVVYIPCSFRVYHAYIRVPACTCVCMCMCVACIRVSTELIAYISAF